MSLAFSTCDYCDAHKADEAGDFRWLPGVFRSYGGLSRFAGPVSTVKCFEDNSLVKAAVESPGQGRVLVVDGAASMRRALLGGQLAFAAAHHGWAGLLINGAVRDLGELAQAQVGILALGHVPMPTDRKGQGLAGVSLQLQGVQVRPGDWLYADADGVVLSGTALHAA
ncbi:ribonuclease E activity regulator RraA [Roseateles oligotrophus]|uniref:4-hydroxy-4-methyl-2-oxoglutarate aldolase n=1 Tax=Roseateles oligotrophus TaxID=1769250 RepID=A0ABT2Y9F6_9BURK|nr:ribonuclease E activity regulator RraA [Roseateles oligotrophus]MCV2366931.1 ribonuclease E activity regulator RraA [Roseateles oligotrophus]